MFLIRRWFPWASLGFYNTFYKLLKIFIGGLKQ